MSKPSHWYCLPLLSSIPEESRASFLAGFCRLNSRRSLESCGEAGWNQSTHIVKWNTHIEKEYSSKMEHSYYYQNGTLIKNGTHQKWNTHQKGTLVSKWNSSKWNTHQTWNSLNRNIHIIKKKREHSYSSWNGNTHIKRIVGNLRQSRNPPSVAVTCLACRLGRAPHPPIPYTRRAPCGFVPSGLGFEWNSPHQQAMDYREEPWILIQRLVENH